jgi:hypothetical protein
MKAIVENKNTYKITGERGDFFITEDNKGKVKMFVKHNVEVVEVESLPKIKVYKQSWSKNFQPMDVQSVVADARKKEYGF